MVAEVVELLRERPRVVDMTVGAGGHAAALLGAGVREVVGVDRDPDALAEASERLGAYGERVRLLRAPFSEIDEEAVGGTADGVLFSWRDPGLGADDAYQVVRDGGLPSTQRDTTFRVAAGAAGAGDRACIRVTVTRDGIAGEASTEKCAELPR